MFSFCLCIVFDSKVVNFIVIFAIAPVIKLCCCILLMVSTAARVSKLSLCSFFALILFVVRCVRVRGRGLPYLREVGTLVHPS